MTSCPLFCIHEIYAGCRPHLISWLALRTVTEKACCIVLGQDGQSASHRAENELCKQAFALVLGLHDPACLAFRPLPRLRFCVFLTGPLLLEVQALNSGTAYLDGSPRTSHYEAPNTRIERISLLWTPQSSTVPPKDLEALWILETWNWDI